jgi:hypothetical protein
MISLVDLFGLNLSKSNLKNFLTVNKGCGPLLLATGCLSGEEEGDALGDVYEVPSRGGCEPKRMAKPF